MTHHVPFSLPDIGQAEIDAVVAVLRSRWLTTGEQCRLFEDEFAADVEARHAVALNSCTAALHLSLEALGVESGDLVYMSPYTFAATAEVVRYLGATPIFVDVEPQTLNIDTQRLSDVVDASKRLGRPRAVIPVHMAGVPCEMDDVWSVARDNDLAVVEDAAHAFPATYRGKAIGSFPHDIRATACFSFYATKTITTGEGGMLVTDDASLAERARSMSLHGLNRQAWGRYTSGGSWRYDIVAAGFKYNLTDIAAAMGRVQLTRAGDMTARRTQIAAAYSAAFSQFDSLQCPSVPDHVETPWHLYLLRLDLDRSPIGRDEFIDELNTREIGTSVHFIPLHLHSYYVKQYGFRADDFPVAEAQFRRVVSLPVYSSMTDNDVERVIAAVSDIVEGIGRDR